MYCTCACREDFTLPFCPPPLDRERARRGSPVRLVGLAVLLAASTWMGASSLLADDILPFTEVKVGMKGEGRSVFQGNEISRFNAEVIGVMQNIAPKRNLILVRLSGERVEKT